ncbi:MAG: acyltransferase family protein, partial [Clostridium sp.]
MGINSKEREFLENLNLLKLIALILVIIGHSTNQYRGDWVFISNQSSTIYRWMAIYVNSIHMQIFVFISGSVYAYCRIKKKYYLNYISLVKDKLIRLIVPYILIGVLFMIPIGMKIGIMAYESGFMKSIKNLILGYSAGYLWFLMMLFMLFLIYYWFEKVLIKISPKISIAILFLLQIVSEKITNLFSINRSIYYMLFFYLGYLAYLQLEKLINLKSKIYKYRYFIICNIFALILICLTIEDKLIDINRTTRILHNGIKDVIAMLGIVQMYTVVTLIKGSIKYSVIESGLNYVNKYNFNIYLLHEPIIFIILS